MNVVLNETHDVKLVGWGVCERTAIGIDMSDAKHVFAERSETET